MGISAYLKEIGRGKDGARALERAQATDLLGEILDGRASDLEIGAFCIAMRVKGETPEELAGFLDAVNARLPVLPACSSPTVVLPCYNGARKLPALTPLLGLLLARRGVRVLVHGQPQDPGRVTTFEVLQALGAADTTLPIHWPASPQALGTQPGVVHAMPTAMLLPGLQRLLDARRVIGLRNSAHSLVKLMQPVADAWLVSSYTHPEYLHSMSALFELTGQRAMLLRGTEGEPVADPRRVPQLDLFIDGQRRTVQAAQSGPLAQLPSLPATHDPDTTATFIGHVLRGLIPVPTPLALQVEHLCDALFPSLTSLPLETTP